MPPILPRLVAIERHRVDMVRLLDVAGRVPRSLRETPVYRVWTVKDLLAHIAAWDAFLLRATEALLAGERPQFARTTVFNKRAVEESRDKLMAAVMRDLRGAHETLMRRLEELDDDSWAAPSQYRYSHGKRERMTIASLFAYTYNDSTHYGGHATEIEDWIKAAAGR